MSRLAEIYHKETGVRGKGKFEGLASTFKERAKEIIDPRNMLFSGNTLGAALGRKIFGAGYSATRRKPGDKSPETVQDHLKGLDKTMMIVARNTMYLPQMAKDMNVTRQNIFKLVKLMGGEPTSKASSYFKSADEIEAELERQRSGKATKEKDGKGEKDGKEKKGFLSSLLDFILSPLKTLKDAFTALIPQIVNLGATLGRFLLTNPFVALGVGIASLLALLKKFVDEDYEKFKKAAEKKRAGQELSKDEEELLKRPAFVEKYAKEEKYDISKNRPLKEGEKPPTAGSVAAENARTAPREALSLGYANDLLEAGKKDPNFNFDGYKKEDLETFIKNNGKGPVPKRQQQAPVATPTPEPLKPGEQRQVSPREVEGKLPEPTQVPEKPVVTPPPVQVPTPPVAEKPPVAQPPSKIEKKPEPTPSPIQVKPPTTGDMTSRQRGLLDVITAGESNIRGVSAHDVSFGMRAGGVSEFTTAEKMFDGRKLSELNISEVMKLQEKIREETKAKGVGLQEKAKRERELAKMAKSPDEAKKHLENAKKYDKQALTYGSTDSGKILGTSAVGRGQWVQGTLQEMLKAQGIKPEDFEKTKFTPELQDKLILTTAMVKRKLDPEKIEEWMNDPKALAALGAEWESLSVKRGKISEEALKKKLEGIASLPKGQRMTGSVTTPAGSPVTTGTGEVLQSPKYVKPLEERTDAELFNKGKKTLKPLEERTDSELFNKGAKIRPTLEPAPIIPSNVVEESTTMLEDARRENATPIVISQGESGSNNIQTNDKPPRARPPNDVGSAYDDELFNTLYLKQLV